jgi:hypothetical protein
MGTQDIGSSIPGTTGNMQGVQPRLLGGDGRTELDRMRQGYADLLMQNAQLRQQNRRLQLIIQQAGLELPPSLAVELPDLAAEEVEELPVFESLLEAAQLVPLDIAEQSLPASSPVPEQVSVEEVEVLKLNLQTARERLNREEARSTGLQFEDEYRRKVLALDNQILSGAQKVVFLALRDYIFTLWDRSNALGQFVRVPFYDLLKTTGLSTDAIGAAIKRLHKVGLVDRQERHVIVTKGRPPETHIYVSLTLLSYSLEIIPDTPKRDHGGDTRFCKFCGSVHLVRKKRVEVVCATCHQLQEPAEVTEEPVNKDDEIPEPEDVGGDGDGEGVAGPQDAGREDEAAESSSTGPDAADDGRGNIGTDIDSTVHGEKPYNGKTVTRSDPPPMPKEPCFLCQRDKKKSAGWIWMHDEGDYACLTCYSPHAWSLREKERQQEAKRQKGDKWKAPF